MLIIFRRIEYKNLNLTYLFGLYQIVTKIATEVELEV